MIAINIQTGFKFISEEIEPKPSTIFCSRKKQRKLPSIPRKTSKSMNDIGTSFKAVSTMKKSRAYKPSNRYDTRINNVVPENSIDNFSDAMSNNDVTSVLCASCAHNFAVRYKNEINKQKNGSYDEVNDMRDKHGDEKHAFLKMITSCHKAMKTCVRREIVEIDAKVLRLTGPSPRSCYVRRNVAELITYNHYRERECRIKTISNETKYIALAKSDNSAILNAQEKKKRYKKVERAELIFDILTKNMQKVRLHPMQLKDSRSMLSCLENYLLYQN